MAAATITQLNSQGRHASTACRQLGSLPAQAAQARALLWEAACLVPSSFERRKGPGKGVRQQSLSKPDRRQGNMLAVWLAEQ